MSTDSFTKAPQDFTPSEALTAEEIESIQNFVAIVCREHMVPLFGHHSLLSDTEIRRAVRTARRAYNPINVLSHRAYPSLVLVADLAGLTGKLDDITPMPSTLEKCRKAYIQLALDHKGKLLLVSLRDFRKLMR